MALAILPPTFNCGTRKNYSIFRDATLSHSDAAAVKASAGRVIWVSLDHKHATESGFLLFYNAEPGNINEGVTAPDFFMAFGALGTEPINMALNLVFDTAISVAASGVPVGGGVLTTDPAVVIMYS